MRITFLKIFPAALLILAAPLAASDRDSAGTDIRIFERVQITDTVAVTAFGIVEDSRCGASAFCGQWNRLIVAAVISDTGRPREVSLQLGTPVPVSGGSLILRSTDTPGSNNGAIPLRKYRLNFAFIPSRD